MSDSISVQDQINEMVELAGARVSNAQTLTDGGGTRGHVKVHADGSAEITGEVTTPARIADDGMDLDAALNQFDSRIAAMTARLAEVAYDPKTGAPSPVLQGREREIAERLLVQERNAAYFAGTRYKQIAEQRERDQSWRNAEAQERLTRLRVTGGDPVKLAKLDELLGDEELKLAAKAMLAARFEARHR